MGVEGGPLCPTYDPWTGLSPRCSYRKLGLFALRSERVWYEIASLCLLPYILTRYPSMNQNLATFAVCCCCFLREILRYI